MGCINGTVMSEKSLYLVAGIFQINQFTYLIEQSQNLFILLEMKITITLFWIMVIW